MRVYDLLWAVALSCAGVAAIGIAMELSALAVLGASAIVVAIVRAIFHATEIRK